MQVGLFKQYGNVLKRTDKLERLFRKPVIIHITKHGNKPAYRMVVGEFSTKSKANAFHKKVKAKGIESFVVNLASLK